MQKPGIPGVTSVACPRCGRAYTDYDTPVRRQGMIHLTARCRHCRAEQLFQVDVGPTETSVVALERPALPGAA